MQQIEEYRVGRNFIRLGDIVKVKVEGKNAFAGRVTAIEGEDGVPVKVTVTYWSKLNGDAHTRRGSWRMFDPEAVTRLDQKKWASHRADYAEQKAAARRAEIRAERMAKPIPKGLTKAQRRILLEVRDEGKVIYTRQATKPIVALVQLGLVEAEWDESITVEAR